MVQHEGGAETGGVLDERYKYIEPRVPKSAQPLQQIPYDQCMTNHTLCRLNPGEYNGGHDEQNNRCGNGSAKWPDGSTYEGEWLNGLRHGKGVFKAHDKSVYDGMFMNDIKNGPGVLSFPDGKKIEGTWQNDLLMGPAKLTQDGITYSVTY